MLQEKKVFNYETNKYSVSKFNKKEQVILTKNITAFRDAKANYFKLLKRDDLSIEELRANNEKIIDACKALASISVDINYKPYILK